MDPLFEVGSGSVKPLAFPREDAAMGLFVVKKKRKCFRCSEGSTVPPRL